jgi:hypothetical protein
MCVCMSVYMYVSVSFVCACACACVIVCVCVCVCVCFREYVWLCIWCICQCPCFLCVSVFVHVSALLYLVLMSMSIFYMCVRVYHVLPYAVCVQYFSARASYFFVLLHLLSYACAHALSFFLFLLFYQSVLVQLGAFMSDATRSSARRHGRDGRERRCR